MTMMIMMIVLVHILWNLEVLQIKSYQYVLIQHCPRKCRSSSCELWLFQQRFINIFRSLALSWPACLR